MALVMGYWEFLMNTGNKILNNHFLKTPIMNNSTENIDNEYVPTAIIVIRENNKPPEIKAIKDYIYKIFATDVEEQLIKDIAMELLDCNKIENRHTHTHTHTHTSKVNSYFIGKKNNTPIDVIVVE